MENNYEDENSNGAENQNNSKQDDLNTNPQTEGTEEDGTVEDRLVEDWTTIQEDPTKIKIDRNVGELMSGILDFIKSTLSLHHGKYDYKTVVDQTKENVVFEGYNVWILICSIVVASIGLDVNSVAVVIGAMLISPLMGPIRGIGFGVGMNDFPLLISSFKNFGVMVGISLVTSFIYFLISPIDNFTNEQILARTEPNFLDAMIAFFGGLAGIIAATNGKNDTVVSGVAIATALMPPLCTAGYGLANGEWTYFLGASYLFLLNSLFIALSTVLLLRYLRFPKREYVSDAVERKVQNYTVVILVLIIAPSAYLFYRMAKRSSFETNTTLFVNEVVRADENLIVTFEPEFDMSDPIIELSIVNSYIDSTTLGLWNNQLENYDLEKAELVVHQGEDFSAMADKKIKEALSLSANQNELVNLLKERELQIEQMRKDFDAYKLEEEKRKDKFDLDLVLRGFQEEYEEINQVAINRSFSVNKKQELDTTYIISVNFDDAVSVVEQAKLKKRLSKRFCFELKEQTNMELDSVSVVNF